MRRLVLVLFLATALVAGCAGDGGSPEAAVAEAATKTADTGSYRASFEIAMSGLPGTKKPVEMTGEGAFDSNGKRGRMTFDMSQIAQAAGGADIGEAELVVDGPVLYMRFPFLRQVQPDLKPWIRIDLRRVGPAQGLDLAGLQQLNQSDPSQALAYLRAASDGVEEVGEEEVRGVETTHYRMTVDLREVAKQTPEQKENIERAIELMGVEKIPTEAWVDAEGLVRRMKLEYPRIQLAPGSAKKGDMTMSMELFDFGVEVDADPPPKNQVTDIGELLGAGTA